MMDFGLTGQIVWVVGPASSVISEVAGAFLEEGAVVRVVTTQGYGRAADKRLQLRSGRDLRVLTLEPDLGPLSPTLLPRLTDMGPPQVVILHRAASARGDPSTHEWDEFLRSRSAEMREGGAVIVLASHDLLDDGDDELEDLIRSARIQHQTWSGLTPRHCAVSVVAIRPEVVTAICRRSVRQRSAPERAQGLAALMVFMASLGRGQTAVVANDGSAHLV